MSTRVEHRQGYEQETVSRNHHATVLAVVLLAASWGAIAGWVTPRGPLTTGSAIASILISAAVGGLAGFVLRSRWAMLLVPVVFVAVYEVVRIGVSGPSVDAVHLSSYGALALLTGRGFQGLLTLLPLALGAAVGAALARRRLGTTGNRWGRVAGTLGLVVVGAGMLVLIAALLRPAATDPITGPDGQAVAGSVAELTSIDNGGAELRMLIRGSRSDAPVLLFLAGGPGGSEFGAMRRHLSALEQHFVVVTWDQRGSGTSYNQLDPIDSVSLDGYVADTIAVTNYLRDRFAQESIYLLGQSWGSTLGVLAVQQQPQLYRAFIGVGQMVSQLATDRIFYEDTLQWAQTSGNDGLVKQLQASGPPPYEHMLDYESALSHEQDVYPYDHTGNSEGSGGMSENLLVEEYALIDQVHMLNAFMDTFAALYPQLQSIDFRESATEFEVPVFFVQGAHEADGRAIPFEQWYPMVKAPVKDLTVLSTSGHRPLWEQPDEFVQYMVTTVLARS